MYKLMATLSVIVRQFYLPNPFECFGDMAVIYNLIAGVILSPIAFAIVGTFYRSGDFPALGSLCYLATYAALTGILCIMGIFSFAWWWILLVVTVIIVAISGLAYLKERYL